MADTEVRSDELHRGRFIAALIEASGALLAVATVLWAGERLWTTCALPKFEIGDIFQIAVLLIAGLGGAAALAGLGEVVRQAGASAPPSSQGEVRYSTSGADNTRTVEAVRELAELTRELRDVTLLNESQRQARLEFQCAQWVSRLEADVPELLRQHNWVRARELVLQARERFPHVNTWAALEQQVEQARAAVETRDVEAVQRQVDDLIKLGAWDRVADVVQELLQRHPNSPRALEIQRRIAREQDKIDTEQRVRLMAQAQAAANDKQWPTALGLSQQLIQRFPRSAEADALRAQLPTLRENAEIYQRHQMESEFRELIRQQDYQAALRLAQDMIERYPNSPQAQVLRGQIGKLLERVTM